MPLPWHRVPYCTGLDDSRPENRSRVAPGTLIVWIVLMLAVRTDHDCGRPQDTAGR